MKRESAAAVMRAKTVWSEASRVGVGGGEQVNKRNEDEKQRAEDSDGDKSRSQDRWCVDRSEWWRLEHVDVPASDIFLALDV